MTGVPAAGLTGGHAHGGVLAGFVLLGLVAAAVAYAVLAVRQRSEGRGWGGRRTASFLAGAVVIGVTLLPPLSTAASGDLRWHVLGHVLAGMVGPLGLVLGAPVTLLLRSVPTHAARAVTRVLRAPAVLLVANPVTALVLTAGGLIVLYLTPLYAATASRPDLGALVHLHFIASGTMFAWTVAGIDPAPHRPSVRTRLVVLGIAICVHAGVSQLMYAGVVAVPAPAEMLRGAAEIMYYGGDIAELLLALALVTTGRAAERARHRAAGWPAVASGAG